MQHKKANMQTPSKSFFSKLIDSKSPESHRRLIVLFFAANFVAMAWYLLLSKFPVPNKELVILCLELFIMTIGGGWASIVADNAFTRKRKSDEPSTQETPTESRV